jgi:hypothetical protein
MDDIMICGEDVKELETKPLGKIKQGICTGNKPTEDSSNVKC